MIRVTPEQWRKIHADYKGRWSADYAPKPEYVGKRTVLSGCISNEIGSLLTEGVHFEIARTAT